MLDERLVRVVDRQPHPLLFATVSGAHLYGFPSPDSDFDLRGAHILPTSTALGLGPVRDTIQESFHEDGIDLDIVTHDIRKFFLMMLKHNGYVLEQVHSPLIVRAMPEFEELRQMARRCVTRFHAMHYLGFFETQWKLFQKDHRAKALLYCYRILLTGIHLMRTGNVEANLSSLNAIFKLEFIYDLLGFKAAHSEKESLAAADIEFHQRECSRLREMLVEAQKTSSLPEEPMARQELNDFLIRLRKVAL